MKDMTRQDLMWVHYPMLVVLYIQSLVTAGDLPGGAGIARMANGMAHAWVVWHCAMAEPDRKRNLRALFARLREAGLTRDRDGKEVLAPLEHHLLSGNGSPRLLQQLFEAYVGLVAVADHQFPEFEAELARELSTEHSYMDAFNAGAWSADRGGFDWDGLDWDTLWSNFVNDRD